MFVRLNALKRLFKAKAFHLHTYGRDLQVDAMIRLNQKKLLQLDAWSSMHFSSKFTDTISWQAFQLLGLNAPWK